MPVPDKHAGESTVEISKDKYELLRQALAAAESWTKEANRIKAEIEQDMGDAYAATVNGKKVIAHRPKNQYAISRLREDYPDLTAHFMKWRTEEVFDVDRFEVLHADILAQYRVRPIVLLDTK